MSAAAGALGAVTREELVEAIAVLDAARTVMCNEMGIDPAVLGNIGAGLEVSLVGRDAWDDPYESVWERNPTVVAVRARSAEVEAEMLTEYAEGVSRDSRRELDERIATCRAMAARYRAHGTTAP